MQWNKRIILILCRNTPWWWSYEPFCLPVVHHCSSAQCNSIALRKGPWSFCLCRNDRALIRAKTHPCGNVVNTVIIFCVRFGRLGWLELDQLNRWSSRDMYVNWNEPLVSCLQLHEHLNALNYTWVRAGGCKRNLPRYPKVRVEPATRNVVTTCNEQLNVTKCRAKKNEGR